MKVGENIQVEKSTKRMTEDEKKANDGEKSLQSELFAVLNKCKERNEGGYKKRL